MTYPPESDRAPGMAPFITRPTSLGMRVVYACVAIGFALQLYLVPPAWAAWRAWQAGVPDRYPGEHRGTVLTTVGGLATWLLVVLVLATMRLVASRATWTAAQRRRYTSMMIAQVIALAVLIATIIARMPGGLDSPDVPRRSAAVRRAVDDGSVVRPSTCLERVCA